MRMLRLLTGSAVLRVMVFSVTVLVGSHAGAQVSLETSTSTDQSTPSLPGIVKESGDIPKRSDLAYEDWRKPELPTGMRSDVHELGRM